MNRNCRNKSTQCYCNQACYQQQQQQQQQQTRCKTDALFDAYRFPTTYNAYTCNPPPSQPTQTMPQQQHQQPEQEQPQQPHLPTTSLTDSGQLAEVLNELTDEISKKYLKRREPALFRQVITVPGPPGKTLQAFRRLPTQQPDVYQRIFVIKPQRDIVDLLISCPTTPEAYYTEKTVYSRPHRPLIVPRLIQTVSSDPQMTSQTDTMDPQMSGMSGMSNLNPFIFPSQNPQSQNPVLIDQNWNYPAFQTTFPFQQPSQQQDIYMDPQYNLFSNNMMAPDQNQPMFNNMYV